MLRCIALGISILALGAFAADKPDVPVVLEGKVVSITDGDTLVVLDASKKQHKIRLEGIDTPESGQAFGTRAKEALANYAFKKSVTVKTKGMDKYGRVLGHIYVGDDWVNKKLVESGYAWHYKQYSTDKDLADAEVAAREKSLGLWADAHPIAPWDYRRGVTETTTVTKPQPPPVSEVLVRAATETVYVTKSGQKYHSGGCRHLSKSKIPISLEDAKARYSPCSVCKPPK